MMSLNPKENMDFDLEAIIAWTPGYIYWKSIDGRFLGCNDNIAEIFGLPTRHAIIGKTSYDFLSKEIADRLTKKERKVFKSGKEIAWEETYYDRQGKSIVYFTNKRPIFDKYGKVVGLLSTSVDITATKHVKRFANAAKIAQKTTQTVKTIASSIAHEIKNPLASIKLAVQLCYCTHLKLLSIYKHALDANLVSNPLTESDLNSFEYFYPLINQRIENATTYIDLQLANLNNNAIDSKHFQPCSIKNIMQIAFNDYPFYEHERDLISWQQDNDFIFFGHPLLTKHILWNLLENALYFIKECNKGRIYIWLDADAQHHYLHFKDTAKGMPASVINKIFDPFYTSRNHGTGMGLPFCQLVMHAYGGEILCEAAEHQYTQFTLKFRQYNISENITSIANLNL